MKRLVAGAWPEIAGDGRDSPATAEAISSHGSEVGCERVRERERESDAVWFDQTGSGQVDPVGSDLWAQGHFGLFTNALK